MSACMCVHVFSDKEDQRHLTPHNLCGVGGIKLFVKKNTFVFCHVCVSQISPDLTHTCTRVLSVSFFEVNFNALTKRLLVRTCIYRDADSLYHTHSDRASPFTLYCAGLHNNTSVKRRVNQ